VNQRVLEKLPPKANLRPAEVASYFDVSTTLIYDLIHEGQIPAFKLGSHYRIPRESLIEAMRNGLTFTPEF
jgi:excisionase family DNA binding protein